VQQGFQQLRETKSVLEMNWEDSEHQLLTIEDLTKVVTFIEEHRSKGSGVLVNCAQGKSRSAAAVVAYLMASGRNDLAVTADAKDNVTAEGDNALGFAEALRLVQERRRMAEPNGAFVRQLQSLEKSGQVSVLRAAVAAART